MTAKKELVKKESEMAEIGNIKDFVGFDEDQSTNDDILIPKILAMQGISQKVTDGEATFGDLVDHVSGRKLGDVKTPVEIIPVYIDKRWIVSKKFDGRWEYLASERVTAGDTYRPYESIVDGIETKNELCYDMYCMVTTDLDMPYIVSFKGTSKRTGQKVTTHFKKMLQTNQLPFAYKMDLVAKKTKNDKGTFIVMDLVTKEKSTREQMIECSKWFKMIKEGTAKANDSDLKKKPTTTTVTDEDQF